MYHVLSIKYKRILLIIFVILTTYYLLLTTAFAEGISLGIDPPIIQINATPPAEILSPITLENRGDSALNLKVDFKPFVPSDREDGQIKYVSESEAGLPDPLIFQRIKILDESNQSINEFILPAKQQKKLTLSLSIPKDSPSSDYYFSVVFLSKSLSSQNTSSSENVFGIASNVLLSVGEGKVSGTVAEFSAPIFLEKGPVPFTVRVKNTSNHFINPKGEILIKNLFNQTIGRVDLLPVNVLADSVRSIPSDTSETSDISSLAFWPEKFILGPYKATLSIALSDTGPLFRRSILFLAFPAKGLAAILLGTLLMIYITLKVKSKI